MEAILNRLATIATEKPIRTLLAVMVVTLSAGWVAGGLRVSTARTALVDDDAVHWQRYMAFAKEFGIPEDLVIVIEGDDPLKVRASADAVAQQLEQQKDQVGSVFHRIDLRPFSARAPLYLGYEQLEMIERLAGDDTIAALRAATSAASRIAAINQLLERAPTLWGEGSAPEELHPMTAMLTSFFVELRRFTLNPKATIQPKVDMVDPALVAKAVGSPLSGSGLDASGYLTTDDGKTAVMFVRPRYITDEIEVVEPFVVAVRQACDRVLAGTKSIRYGLTGIPASQIDERRAIERDTLLTTAIALAGVVLLFLLFFSSPRLLVLSLMPVLVGVVLTAAAARILYGYLNLMSSIFLVILIGMGIDFSIHVTARFIEALKESGSPTIAARQSILNAGRGVLTGGLTSAGAFGAVGFSEFRGMAELGVVACIGLTVTMFAALVVLPALLIVAGPSTAKQRPEMPGALILSRGLIRTKWPAMIIALAITVPAAWYSSTITFDYSLVNLLPRDAESARLMELMLQKRELSANGAVALASSLEEARAIEKKFSKLPSVFRASSAASFLPENQVIRRHRLQEINALLTARREAVKVPQNRGLAGELEYLEAAIERLQDLSFRRGDGRSVADLEESLGAIADVLEVVREKDSQMARARVDAYTATLMVYVEEGIRRLEQSCRQGELTASDLPPDIQSRFVSSEGRYAVYVVPRASIWDRAALGQFLDETRAVAPNLTGFAETFYENTTVLKQGFFEAAAYAALAVVLLLLLDMRRFAFVALGVIPLGIGTVWMLWWMHLTSIDYNLANIVALPLIIGVGIDNTVHLLHRYREDEDLQKTISRTGSAVVLSSLTTMVGFGALHFASHRGLSSLGEVLFIGVGSCLAAALAILPAGLTLATRTGKNGS